MSYKTWFDAHAQKHKIIVDKLVAQGLSKEQIVEYFDFENMLEKEHDFCPLYAENKKCHEMKNLNCYFCACPNFRFDDSGVKRIEDKTQYSFCAIDSEDGKQGVFGESIHQDCSACKVPHGEEYILKHFYYEWKTVMKKCIL